MSINYTKYIILIVISSLALSPIKASPDIRILELEQEIQRINDEINQRQHQIIQLLSEHELSDNVSLYKKLFKESPKDIREKLVFLIMKEVRDESINIKQKDGIHELLRSIINSEERSKDYKLRMAEIFFIWEIEGFTNTEQSLRSDVPLSGSLSEEAKSFYISYSSSLIRFLYLSRWLEENE